MIVEEKKWLAVKKDNEDNEALRLTLVSSNAASFMERK